ncbi:hypothetical protein EC973_003954 [Apophysomyces ossiformis]|uniref:Major facilitator superfamily (MFS) profile domain-containing protein n=1 Tax=Apophysomyces ossiformis TaxID=679940 RepID=A0A8H7BKR9_9FUNG|nr:hypothetical protein EC973_003954 [Apophysomyces ossiformis]
MTVNTLPSESSLKGVKKVELFKQVWSKADKIIVCVGLALLSWASSWESSIIFIITPTVSSLLGANNLTAMIPIVLAILQTALLPMYSKIADMLGRAEAYSFSLLFYMVSFIVMATATNYDTIIGGKALYAIGHGGCIILAPILIGDLSSVVNRGLFQALYTLPSLLNFATTPFAAEALMKVDQWRWVYGMIPLIILVAAAPLLTGLWHAEYKVRRIGMLAMTEKPSESPAKKSIGQRILWLINEIDLIGSLLLIAGLYLILLPMVLARARWGGWNSPTTLGTLISGVVAWILFGFWEWKMAKKPVISVGRWESRNPVYGVLAASVLHLINSTNWQYLLTYLQVTRRASPTKATFMQRAYVMTSIVVQVGVGYCMKRTRIWRPFVWVGVALLILGVALMIPARLPSSSDAFIVVAQVVAGIGAGFLEIPIMVAVQSSVPHSDLAIVTSLFQLGHSVGVSVGSAMAGAIWNSMLPNELMKYVPGQVDYRKVMASIQFALALPQDQYEGVVRAYGEVQKTLSIIACCLSVLVFVFSVPLRSFGLDESEEDRVKAASAPAPTIVEDEEKLPDLREQKL